ncbi:MAG: hypothetical protein IPM93_27375 [Candidatus Obscuribacter sp.]|nr:hypothetical protein [Candidatus Obscuribacter sp.]
MTNFDWYPTDEDERLQQIRNLGPSGNTISQFGYRYDPADQIKQVAADSKQQQPLLQPRLLTRLVN